MSTFAERLKQARLKQGLSLAEVAERLGISHGAVAKWEQGRARPRLKRLIALSKILQVRPDDLLRAAELRNTPDAILQRARERLAAIWDVPPETVLVTATRVPTDGHVWSSGRQKSLERRPVRTFASAEPRSSVPASQPLREPRRPG